MEYKESKALDKVTEQDIKKYVVKREIGTQIKETMHKKHYSIRTLANQIGMSHPQIVRITNCENYNIDTLIKVLDQLGLELKVEVKK
ncbi:helix-turn-helix domain-containing protein [Bacillus sp. Brlt_9]|uniref:helix-turn-helix domain-containing protein n=1 Tax=Bacillus sp. Brlt_9 TaxID=3110916 RepID=UPI003F7C226C